MHVDSHSTVVQFDLFAKTRNLRRVSFPVLLQEKDGKPYHARNRFTCKAQAEGFRELLETMSERPQDYITPSGRMTTNTVEGFHGLTLMYRDKRTDFGHKHYVCKTNMGVCHKVHNLQNILSSSSLALLYPCLQNLGPMWKVLCCAMMGVPVPLQAANAILEEQQQWERKWSKTADKDYIHKR